LRVRYPGLKAIDVGIPLLERTMEIVGEGQLEKVIWDRWFFVGALLDYLDKYMDLNKVCNHPEDAPEQDRGDERDSSL